MYFLSNFTTTIAFQILQIFQCIFFQILQIEKKTFLWHKYTVCALFHNTPVFFFFFRSTNKNAKNGNFGMLIKKRMIAKKQQIRPGEYIQ